MVSGAVQAVLAVCLLQAEDGIRDLVRSRGLGDVYKRQKQNTAMGGSDAGAGVDSAVSVRK